jgi:hypothetical protein
MPASGGGGPRPRTGVSRSLEPVTPLQAFKPGQPVVRHVRNVTLRAGKAQRVAIGCAKGERLVGASHALGFYTDGPPGPALVVTARLATSGGRAVVSVRNSLPSGIRAVAQVVAICGGGQ